LNIILGTINSFIVFIFENTVQKVKVKVWTLTKSVTTVGRRRPT